MVSGEGFTLRPGGGGATQWAGSRFCGGTRPAKAILPPFVAHWSKTQAWAGGRVLVRSGVR